MNWIACVLVIIIIIIVLYYYFVIFLSTSKTSSLENESKLSQKEKDAINTLKIIMQM